MPRGIPNQIKPEAPAVHVAAKANRTVTVACKFPPGLILQLQKPTTIQVPLMGGGFREVQEFHRVGDPVYIRGPAEAQGTVPKGYIRPQIESGYAMTHGVDAAFFEEWLKQNAGTDLVRNKVVLAAPAGSEISAQARDNEARVTGFEPVNPDGDWRVPKPLNPGVDPIKTAEREAA